MFAADRGCLDSGQDAHPIEQAIPERSQFVVVPNFLPVLVLLVFRFRQLDRSQQNIARIEIERRILRMPKAFQRQSRARKKDDRECDLRNHKP